MTAYSMDLRKRVLRAWDAGMGAEAVAVARELAGFIWAALQPPVVASHG